MVVGVAYVVGVGVVCAVIILIAAFVFKHRGKQNAVADLNDNEPRGQVRQRGAVGNVGPPRREVRRRLAQRRRDDEETGSDVDNMNDGDDELGFSSNFHPKIGTKKQRKLEEKAARKAHREAEEEERRERREYEEKEEQKRKKLEEIRQKEEAAKSAEEQRLREEEARREYEEYQKLKEQFTIDAEGVEAQEQADVESLLQKFVSYIEQMKVVMLEDLAAHFKLKTQEAIDRVRTLQEQGRLSGVIDDRGKFICITESEYDAIAKFIKQRGRVSISELADSMNRLIRLQPDSSVCASQADVTVCA